MNSARPKIAAQCVRPDESEATVRACRSFLYPRSEGGRGLQEHRLALVRRHALDAAQFYARTFPDSSVGAILRAPGDYPAGKQGEVLTVEFTLVGIPCLGLNGGPAFPACA
jgi:3-demethylubiquinone-9 3-methyltransferase